MSDTPFRKQRADRADLSRMSTTDSDLRGIDVVLLGQGRAAAGLQTG